MKTNDRSSGETFQSTSGAPSAVNRFRHDGYHIAAMWPCQGRFFAAERITRASMLYDHVDLRVSDITKTRNLYDTLLPALGCTDLQEDSNSICYYAPGFDRKRPFFGIIAEAQHRPNESRIAFRATSIEDVDRLAGLAKQAGALAYEAPHVCDEYTPFYYAAFFEDADGNKLEICYREAP
jgi:catechol 2,3-dioxygenase-like lactoylglutathione lyase family enzyme